MRAGAAPISYASRATQRAPFPHMSTSPPSGLKRLAFFSSAARKALSLGSRFLASLLK